LCGTDEMRVGLFQLHLATAEQLCRLHYSRGSLKAIKRRLKVLGDNGFVQPSRIIRGSINSGYYYTLGKVGMKHLEVLGFDVNEAWRQSKEVNKHGLFVEHTLELNDVIIAAALIGRANPQLYLGDFTHERVLKRQPYTAKLDGRTWNVIPDAFLDFRSVGNELHFSV